MQGCIQLLSDMSAEAQLVPKQSPSGTNGESSVMGQWANVDRVATSYRNAVPPHPENRWAECGSQLV